MSDLGGYGSDRPPCPENRNELFGRRGREWTDAEWEAYNDADRKAWKAEQEQIRAEATSAPEMEPERVRAWQEWLPDKERNDGKPTRGAVFDAAGERGVEVSGWDDPYSELVADWIEESDWQLPANKLETHVEAKVVAKMLRGDLPNHITLVLNNDMCDSPNPNVPSCKSFAHDSLHPGMSLRVYNIDGTDFHTEGTP